jgi:hypothetical protein
MIANVGTLDRALRVVLGIALIALSATGQIGAWGYVGIVPLLTAAFRYCPLYSALGFSSRSMKR